MTSVAAQTSVYVQPPAQHQMPGVPGDLVAPDVPPEMPGQNAGTQPAEVPNASPASRDR